MIITDYLIGFDMIFNVYKNTFQSMLSVMLAPVPSSLANQGTEPSLQTTESVHFKQKKTRKKKN